MLKTLLRPAMWGMLSVFTFCRLRPAAAVPSRCQALNCRVR